MDDPVFTTHEIVTIDDNGRFDSEEVWKGATLVVSREEFSQKARAAGCDSRGLKRHIARLEARDDDYQELGGLMVFTRWLLTRRVQGPKVRMTLLQLLSWEYSRLKCKTIEEKDSYFSTLLSRLRELPLSTSSKKRPYVLGDLVPDSYLMLTGRDEQTIRLAATPPQSLDRMMPQTEIYLLNDVGDPELGSSFKGCTPCKPDPSSSRGGLKFCVFPGFEGYVECEWPPPPQPPPPEPKWEYYVKVGNSWWTTFLGVWHGSGYTRTFKKSQNTTVPWIVPELHVHVMEASGDFASEDYCFSLICYGGCGDEDTSYNDHEVSVGATALSIVFGPWGINSRHAAAGRSALYCDGRWSWS
jgi:hypothetical protein